MSIFEFAFGEEWHRVGEIVIWLLPWYFFKLLASPIAMVMNVVGRQKQLMYMKLGAMFLRLCFVLFALVFFNESLIEFYAVSGALVNLFNLVIFLNCADTCHQKKIVK